MAQNDKNNDAEECAVPNSEAVNLETLFPPPFLPEKGLPTARVAYSDRTAAVMAKFARLAYIPFEQGESDEAFLREQLHDAGFHLLKCYQGTKKQKWSRNWGTQAFIATGEEFNVLAFRGTTDFRDWRTNFNFLKKKIYINEEDYIRVHRGFWSAYNFGGEDIEFDLNHLAELQEKPLYITGHSLGGALAQIATAYSTRDSIAACYTFGAPRVGNKKFDIVVKPPHYRVTNNNDFVPGIPFYFMGYRHSGDPRHIEVNPVNISRHDIFFLKRIIIDSIALFGSMFLGKSWAGVADHDMNLYIQRLDEIAGERADLTTLTPLLQETVTEEVNTPPPDEVDHTGNC